MTNNGAPNRVYRVVWNACKGVWQAVSEAGRGRARSTSAGRVARRMQVAALASLAASSAFAGDPLPAGGHVVAGSGSITPAANGLTISQDSARLAIDWSSFDIGQGRQVRFVQPTADAVALNRVTGSDPSLIQGTLSANGHVYLVNPNGVTFTNTARVDVGGLVASTLDITNADFMAGRDHFGGTGAASGNAVINQGRITTAAGGTVALVAARIVNDGTISAPQGNVLMGAGDEVTLDLGGPVKVRVDKGALDALIRNGGAILADGGTVYLDARAAGDLVSTVINQTGTIEARTLATGRQGQIVLLGDMQDGRVEVGGTLDASAPDGGHGGAIETSGAAVRIAPDVHVTSAAPHGDAGTWLIDPYDIVVASTGGDVTGATLSTALNSGNVTLDTTASTYGSSGAGTITVNDAITKTGGAGGGTTLTLKAHADIDVNAPITSTGGRLNVVLTADQDNSGAGNVNFGAGGRVVTNGGNFYVGSVSGTYDTVAPTAHDFTMANGSYVDVGTGRLDVEVKHDIVLPDNSAQDVAWALHSTADSGYVYFDSGSTQWWSWLSGTPYTQSIALGSTGGAIASANSSATNADIVTGTDVRLNAGSIGTSGAPIRISGKDDIYGLATNPTWSNLSFPQVGRTLFLTNEAGSSYVDEVGVQVLSTVNVTVGSQASATQEIRLMGDQGGTGHLHLQTDGSGVLNLATGDVSTGGVPGIAGSMTSQPQGTDPSVFPTSVTLAASNITFANDSADTGAAVMYYSGGAGSGYKSAYGMSPYSASFTATANSLTGAQVDGVADIRSQSVSMSATSIGTSSQPVELGSGNTLWLDNLGGSTFLKVVDDSVGTVSLTTRQQAGEHHVLWATGDHIDFTTDTTGELVPTLSGGRSDGASFTATQGVDLSGGNRGMTFYAEQGQLRFDTNSVDLGGGAFSAIAYAGYGSRAIYGVHAMDGAAEITAGDVSVTLGGGDGSGGSITDLEFAHGGTSTDNTLRVFSPKGDISLAELTPGHFKNIYIDLDAAEVAQHVQVALAGPDDIDITDTGSRITLDGSSAAVGGGNRNFNLAAPQRVVQIDGTALGTGSYEVQASALYLDGDLLTNGGAITLATSGLGIVAMRDVTIGSNADDAGNTTHAGSAGSVLLGGDLSASVAGAHIAVQSTSSDAGAGQIQFYSNIGNAGGQYLAGVSFDARGATASQDSTVWLYGSSYRLNGDFASYGTTYLWTSSASFDTEQGNVADAGNVTFGGAGAYFYPYGSFTFDTSTTAAGKNGGNVDLRGSGTVPGTLQTLVVDASGGAGGHGGDVTLGALDTTLSNGSGAIGVTGRTITLGGNLSTNDSAVALHGDVQVDADVTIDTWYGTNSAASGTAGAVTIDGALGATRAGLGLTIDTSTATGTVWSNEPTETVPFTQNAGAVTITAGATGGVALGTLSVNTAATGLHNGGTNGAISASGVTTTGDQSYAGGTLAVAGDLTSGGTVSIDVHDAGTTLGGAGVIQANALAVTGNDTTVDLVAGGDGNKVGTVAISGAAGVQFLNDDVALTIGDAGSGSGISATGAIDVATRSANLVVARDVQTTDTSSSAIVLEAGRSAAAGTAAGGDLSVSGTPQLLTGTGGRTTLYTGGLAGSTGLGAVVAAGDSRYDSDSTTTNFTSALGSGTYAVYREQPQLDVTASASKTYDGLAFTGGSFSFSGLVNGDTAAILTGTPTFGGTAQGAVDAGTYSLTVSGGIGNGLGYAIVPHDGTLTVGKAALTVTAGDAGKTYDGHAFTGGSVSYDGLVNGETASVLGGTLAYGGSSQGAVNAGSYAITASGLTSGNYDIAYVPGTLTVGKAALTVTAGDAGKTYDGHAFTGGSVSYDGLVNGETASVLGGTLAYGGSSQGAVNAGSYAITASGLTSGNYDIAYVPGTLTVGKAALTITAGDASKTYDGHAFAGGSVSYDGLVNGETASVLGGTLAYGGSSQGAVNAGSYAITASGLTSGNYDIAYVPGTLTVGKAALTVTAGDAGKTYDGHAFTGGSVSYDGFVNGETADVLGGTLAYGGSSQGAVNAGSYAITASGLTSGNYEIAYVPGTLTVGKAALTVTAGDASKTYDGHAFSGGSVSYDGFVNGETADVLGGTLAYGGSSQGAVNAGSYAITASGHTSGNYDIAYVPGTLTVGKAALTITAGDASKTYDGHAFAGGSVSYDGLVNGETASVLGGTLAYGGSSQGAVNAGSYAITASGLTSGNYDIAYVPGTLTVGKAALTVTAGDAGKTYDGHAFTGGSVSYDGLVNGETASVLGGTPAYGGSSQGAVNAGSYAITVSGLSSDNYDIAYVPGTLTVGKAALTVTGNDYTKFVDGLPYAGGNGVRYTGFAGSDGAASSLGGTLAYGGSAQGAIGVGSYDIGLGGLTAANYDIRYVDGTLHVLALPEPLVAAVTIAQGSTVPFTGGVAGSSVVPLAGAATGSSTAGDLGTPAGLKLVDLSASGTQPGGEILPPGGGGTVATTPGLLNLYVVHGGINPGPLADHGAGPGGASAGTQPQ